MVLAEGEGFAPKFTVSVWQAGRCPSKSSILRHYLELTFLLPVDYFENGEIFRVSES